MHMLRSVKTESRPTPKIHLNGARNFRHAHLSEDPMRAWLLALPLLSLSSAVRGPATDPLAPIALTALDQASGPSHTLALGRFRGEPLAFVADEDRAAVLTFSLSKEPRFVARTALPSKPSSIRRLASGELAVTLRDQAKVLFLGAFADGLRIVASTDVCTEPVSTTSTDDTLFVVCAWGHAMDTVSIRTHARLSRVDLPREPRAAVLDQEGEHLYVSHAVGSRLSIVERASGQVRAEDLGVAGLPAPPPREDFIGFGSFGMADREPPATDETRRPRTATQGFSLAFLPAGTWGRVFLPEVLVSTRPAPLQGQREAPPARTSGYGGDLSGGIAARRGSSVPALTTMQTYEGKVRRARSTEVRGTSSCLLPRAAVTTADGRVLVTCLGSDRVVEYNGLADDPDAHVRALTGVGRGPTGIAVVGDEAVVWSSFDRVLTRFELASGLEPRFQVASDEKEREPDPFEVGRRLFHRTDSFNISGDGRACASCHPDGRDDGLVWSSPDGPRQTPMLAGRLADTAPFGWTGDAATVRAHLKQTFARLGGRGLDDKSLYALLTYVAKMAPPPAPSAPVAREAVTRGKQVFESYNAGCSGCHDPARGYTDGEKHDVGSAVGGDAQRSFETPSLHAVGGTAPYFHDGRFASLDDVLRHSPQMADTSALSPRERGDLLAFLESL